MFNRKVTILVLLVFSLVGCATHESRLVGIQSTDLQSTDKSKVVSLQMDIDDLSKVYNQSPTDESTTLYVFDIDDTLLTAGTDFGSDYWFGWQFDAKNQNKVACPLDLLPITVNIISIHKTQVDAAAIFNSIKANKIIVTSRDALSARGATIKMLTKPSNGFVLPQMLGEKTDGLSYYSEDKNKQVTYSDGILMVTGQDKGKELIHVLTERGVIGEYKTIVFVDDGQTNINKVATAAADKGLNFIGLHYIRIAKPKDVDAELKDAWLRKLERVKSLMNNISFGSFDQIKDGPCFNK